MALEQADECVRRLKRLIMVVVMFGTDKAMGDDI
jgi:hypothetical protein